jgi:5-methylcytosine-specific restriction endonuclease McrA
LIDSKESATEQISVWQNGGKTMRLSVAAPYLDPEFSERSIDQLLLSFGNGQVNLTPGFQRKSVWTLSDRRRLIQSIVEGYPLPSIFLYQRDHKGKLIYDVIDGKQRLETIFMFMGQGRFKRHQFDVRLDLGEGGDWYDWKSIKRWHPQQVANINSYKIQTVEISGELPKIIDLFVRINSTGKRLTSGEKRHAKFYTSAFLKASERLVSKFYRYLKQEKILSQAQIDRMKGVELFAELLMSVQNGGPINKKTSLDRAIGNDAINGNTLHRLTNEVARTIRLVKRIFPDLHQTRFHNSAEFYSLFLLVWEMDKDKCVLTDRKRNSIANSLLRKLSTEVDKLRDQLRKAKPAKVEQRIYQEYLLSVQGDTDSAATRERRRQILRNLLWSLFERKDERRLFSPEQRRILWNSEQQKTCAKCKKPLRWQDLSVDHIRSHVRGGKTVLKNAQLMHRSCNASKGAR